MFLAAIGEAGKGRRRIGKISPVVAPIRSFAHRQCGALVKSVRASGLSRGFLAQFLLAFREIPGALVGAWMLILQGTDRAVGDDVPPIPWPRMYPQGVVNRRDGCLRCGEGFRVRLSLKAVCKTRNKCYQTTPPEYTNYSKTPYKCQQGKKSNL